MRFNFYNEIPSTIPSHRDWVVPSNVLTFHHHLLQTADTQAKLVAKDVLPRLCSLLVSSSEDVRRAAVALLWVLSQYPHNQVWQLIP